MTAVLLAALAAPFAGAVACVVVPHRAAIAVRAAALVAAAAWLALLLHGSRVSLGFVHSVPLVAAAALGAAVVIGASVILDGRTPTANVAAGIALAATGLGLASGHSATNGAGLVCGLAVAGAIALWSEGAGRMTWVLAGAGAVASAVGVVALRLSTAGSWELAGAIPLTSSRAEGLLLLLGAVLLALAGSVRVQRPVAVLVPGGLFLAAVGAPLVRVSGGHTAVAIAIGGLACAAAAAGRAGRPLFDRPSAGLGVLAVAALVAPGACRPAALLLAAAAALAAALELPVAASLGAPGLIALAIALATRGGVGAFVIGMLAGGVALALAATARRSIVTQPSWWAAPAAATGTWLLLAPNTWRWVGFPGLAAYDAGAARAAAGAALVLVIATFRSRVPAGWYARTSPPVGQIDRVSSDLTADPGEDAVRH